MLGIDLNKPHNLNFERQLEAAHWQAASVWHWATGSVCHSAATGTVTVTATVPT